MCRCHLILANTAATALSPGLTSLLSPPLLLLPLLLLPLPLALRVVAAVLRARNTRRAKEVVSATAVLACASNGCIPKKACGSWGYTWHGG